MNKEKLYQKVKNDYNLIVEHFSNTRQFNWPEFADFKPYLKSGQRVLDLGCGNGRLYFSFLKDFNLEYHGIDFSERLIEIAIQKKNKKAEVASQNASHCHSRESGNLEGVKTLLTSWIPAQGGNDKEEATSAIPKPIFKVGELTNIPFKENYFDAVLCIATFHHLPSKKLRLKALSEMKRVLKPNSYLLMTNWYWWQKFPWQYFFNKWWQKNFWNDLFIPWEDAQGNKIVDLYYHAFTKGELTSLIKNSGLKLEKIYLTGEENKIKKKSRINLVTICQK